MSDQQVYEIQGGDLILGQLKLSNPCKVKVVVTSEYVYLYIGPRDWQWYRNTGKLMGSGTGICGSDE